MPLTTPPPGAACWFELVSTDPGASATFPRGLLGWTTVDMALGPMGTYSFLRNANGTVGALCSLPHGAPPHSSWNVYFGVTHADAATRRAKELGVVVMAEAFDVGEHGRMSMLRDSTGAPSCLCQSRASNAGDFVLFEDHAIGWVGLASRDPSPRVTSTSGCSAGTARPRRFRSRGKCSTSSMASAVPVTAASCP